MNTIKKISPSKINIGLRITGRRPNGYHEIESLFWPTDLADVITIKPSAENKVEVSIPNFKDTIVSKALSKLKLKENVHVHIQKKIPVGGGLGGGSSNAGTVIQALSDANADVALGIGADVPFFLKPQPAWVTGVGEKIQYLKVEEDLYEGLSILFIILPFGCNTQEIFQDYVKSGIAFSKNFGEWHETLTRNHFLDYLKTCRNDLEPVLVKKYPVYAEILSELRSTGCLYAGITGTGSTCFALYADKNAKNNIKVNQDFYRTKRCETLWGRSPLWKSLK